LAPRRPTPPQPQAANLTIDQMKLGITRLQRRISDLEAFDPQSVPKRFPPEVTALETSIEETLAAVFGHGTLEFNRYIPAARLDRGPPTVILSDRFRVNRADPLQLAHRYLTEGKQAAILLLQQGVRGLEEEIGDREVATPETAVEAPPVTAAPARKVFVVHGHDEGAREAVARFLERLGFEAIILHERANQGRTVIEKVEAHGNVSFAVVILTPDDEGCAKGEAPQPRARQNVMLELGYFVGRLGRGRVCALKRGELEMPSDFGGVVYEPFDAGGAWKLALGRELKAAHFDIDWNKVHE